MADFWGSNGYQDEWDGSGSDQQAGGYVNGGEYGADDGGDVNPAGAADDPFSYTKGSLLTPWEGHFDGSKYGSGGGGVAAYTPFKYADFSYNAGPVGGFDERYNDPGNFVYGDYKSGAPFAGVTDKDMKADKGYQVRVAQGQKALEASKAAQGILKSGGTAKALTKYGQDMGSQEYGNVYGRKANEYDRTNAEGRFSYQTNRSNAAENFDRNTTNSRSAYQVRQGAWRDNAANAQTNVQQGYQVAQGTYDRNEAKARQGYEDAAAHAQAVASAGSSAVNQAYSRALDEYKMSRDEFYTNQDRQYAILSDQDRLGRDASYRYADTSAGLAVNRGDAQASGVVGSANAYNGALGSVASSATDMGLMAMRYGLPRTK